MEIESIERVAFFINMLLCSTELDFKAANKELKESTTILSFDGNGTSDILTYKQLKNFMEEVGNLKKI